MADTEHDPLRPNQVSLQRLRSATNRYAALRGETNKTDAKESTSYAQVESFGCQNSGSQDSGELKLDGTRTSRVVIRFTQEEKGHLGSQAEKARLPLANYIRLTLLRLPSLDPDRHKLLLKLNLELTRQGTNLNQIAKQLNGKVASPNQAESLLAMIARTMMQAHKAVHAALTNSRGEA